MLFLKYKKHFTARQMRISEDKIEEIRSRINIVDYISAFIGLKKRGKNYIGLCPFHHEKTPSFTVSQEKQIFHCFGCHAGGNVFKFAMDYKNLSFMEAVQEMAQEAGVSLDVGQGSGDEFEKHYEILKTTARHFANNLYSSNEGARVRNYLQERKIKVATGRAFGLGYSLPSGSELCRELSRNNMDIPLAASLGLLSEKEGRHYDSFRDRLMFPIFSPNGRVIAFGGRTLSKDKSQPKYINSPESGIYHKRKTLYGLFQSKEEIRRLGYSILVEGYMDLISLSQEGVKNVVASSGTALTQEQVTLLSRYSKNIRVLFDGDLAGQKASMRSIELLLKEGFDLSLVTLPKEEDPDSYIHKYGADEFRKVLDQGKNFIEYKTEQFKAQGLLSDSSKQADAIRDIVKSISLIPDELKQSLLIKSVSQKFGLREKLLETELMKLKEPQQWTPRERPQPKSRSTDKPRESLPRRKLERELLKLIFSGKKEVLRLIFGGLQGEEIENEVVRGLFCAVMAEFDNGCLSPSDLISKIGDENLRNSLLALSFEDPEISDKWEEFDEPGQEDAQRVKYARDVVREIKKARLAGKMDQNIRKMAGAETEAEVISLMKENQRLEAEIKEILKNIY